ncbi:PREDICTED: dnaJ protein homolog 1-like [Ipomoea nil]|uniref:dnaJ protein homolog 1-like n=1 Tax=Ipomoea nil TaxID=35883 RepID=UPI000900CC03|nr:PREDICTED: dnaJ protein homolog 1-like [Ipomoea nil]
MGHHPKSATPSYNLLGVISKATNVADICKAFAKKWHVAGRNTSNHRDKPESKFISINEAKRAISSRKRDKQTATFDVDNQNTPKGSSRKTLPESLEQDEDEELFISGPRLLSRTTSRLAISPKFSKSSSRKGNKTPRAADFYAHLERSTSFSGTQSHDLLGTSSKRTATPIILSESISRRKPPPVEKRLECTLEELCYGCTKEVKITREILSNTGLIIQEEEYVTIKVKPEWRRGTKITFEGKGDERPGCLPADVIFVIEEKKHSMFKREGDDLELGVQIPLVQALTGCTITVPTLGGGEMILNLDDEIIYPGLEKTIPGQGMPNNQGQRGDLRLRFLVGFPTDLSEEQRSQVASILRDCC